MCAYRKFFWAYALVAVVVLIEQILIAPSATYMRLLVTDVEEVPEAVIEAAVDPIAAAAGSSFSRVADELDLKKEHATPDAMTGILYGQSAGEQMKSKWFMFVHLLPRF